MTIEQQAELSELQHGKIEVHTGRNEISLVTAATYENLEDIFKQSGQQKPSKAVNEQDQHSDLPIPPNKRQSALTMGMLWVTMVTGSPCLLMGFQWQRMGFTLAQVIFCTVIGSIGLLVYMIPASLLGAHSGRSLVSLSKLVFGRVGTYLVTANILWVMMSWYAVMSLLLADGLSGLFHWSAPLAVAAFACAIAMSFNNLFGFKGIANFARFFAAPIIVVCAAVTFYKASGHCIGDVSLLQKVSHPPTWVALTTISSFVLGFAAWGNEPDYWRYAKPRLSQTSIPLILSIFVGQILCPVTGWLVAHSAPSHGLVDALSLLHDYSFCGLTWLAALVMLANYFAPAGSKVFALATAITGQFRLNKNFTVFALALIGGAIACWLATTGVVASLQSICELNAIILPPAVIVMLVEWFMQRKIWGMAAFFEQDFDQLPAIRWTAVSALLAGIIVGIATSGMIPGLNILHVGVPPLQAWLTTAVVYIVLNALSPGYSILGRR